MRRQIEAHARGTLTPFLRTVSHGLGETSGARNEIKRTGVTEDGLQISRNGVSHVDNQPHTRLFRVHRHFRGHHDCRLLGRVVRSVQDVRANLRRSV